MSSIATGGIAAREGTSLGTSIAWYLPALVLAAALGAATALGGKLMLVFSFGAVGGLVLLFAPIELVLGFFLVVTFVVVGPIASIGKVGVAQWVPYMLALVLFVRVPMEWYQNSRMSYSGYTTSARVASPTMWAVYSYLVLVGVSLATNLPSPLPALVGAKLYLLIWGIFFLLFVSRLSPRSVEAMWKGLLFLALLQLPFAFYQRLVEVPKRLGLGYGINSLDAIVGTFPGGEGGGANGSLAMFCVFAMAFATSLWRNKVLCTTKSVVVILTSLASIALGEVKVIVVLFPLAFLILYRKDVIRRPLHFIGAGVLIVAILGGILTAYRDASKMGQGRSTLEHIQASFDYIFDPNNIKPNGNVGRFASLYLWYRDGRSNPQTFLVGYGPGASQNSSVGQGVVAARFAPLGINSTTAAGMLWDIGVVGLAAFLVILAVAFFEALKLAALPQIPAFHRSTLEASAVMMALAGVMVPYDSDLLSVPQFQVLFLLALFHVVYWRSQSSAPSTQPAPIKSSADR